MIVKNNHSQRSRRFLIEYAECIEIIKEGLGTYPLTPIIAETIKFILTNRYESLIVINEKGEIEFIDRPTEKFLGEAKGKKYRKSSLFRSFLKSYRQVSLILGELLK